MTNLLPQEHKTIINRLYRKRFLAVVFCFVTFILLVGIGMLVPSYLLSRENEDVLARQRDVFANHETSGIAESLAVSISAINEKLGTFSSNVPNSPLIGSVIEPVLSVKGKGVQLTDFQFESASGPIAKANVRISGVAQNRETLLLFTDRVKELPGFQSVDLPIISFIKNENVSFTISAVVTLR